MKLARAIGLPVPLPISYGSHTSGIPGSILMTRIAGDTLLDVHESLTPQELENIKQDLARCLRLMRSYISPFGSQVCSLSGHSIRSLRVPFKFIGPCENEEVFQAGLSEPVSRMYFKSLEDRFTLAEAKAFTKTTATIPHKIVFTHGDLWHHNIMVHEGRLAGIIDWEAAGWLPEYWECTTILRARKKDSWWTRFVRDIWASGYEDELEREKVLWVTTFGVCG